MKRTATLLLAAAMAATAAGTAADETPTGEDLIRKNLDARGGAEAWSRVSALKVEGTWTAFSIDSPMTILRMRPDKYRFEHVLFDAPAVLGYDGTSVWVQGAMYGAPDGEVLTEAWKQNVLEDAPFGPLLPYYAKSGAKVTLDGKVKLEGQDVWKLRVEPAGLPPETWYLDPQTFLEVKRVSRTYDVFSGPDVVLDMDTFYLDFRDVSGVKVPYHEEQHFGTRYVVFEAAKVTANPEVDLASFRAPEKKESPTDAEPSP